MGSPKEPVRVVAERMARELDVGLPQAEAAVRHLIRLGLIRLVLTPRPPRVPADCPESEAPIRSM